MDIQAETRDRGATFMAALAALLIAASLIYMAWDGVRRQRELLDRHLALTAGVVSRGVQVHLIRRLRPFMPPPPEAPHEAPDGPGRHPGPGRHMGQDRRGGFGMGSATDEFFRETVQGSDIRFLGLVASDGRTLSSFGEPGSGTPHLPAEALQAMRQGQGWVGLVPVGGTTVFVHLDRAMRSLAQLCERDESLSCSGPEGVWFVLGLGVDEYLRLHAEDMRAAMYQTGFVLGAATLFLFLARAYARRREAGRRLARLEHFNSQLLDTMPDGLLSVDADGRIGAANAAVSGWLGEGLVGRPLAEVLPDALSKVAAEAAGAGGPVQTEVGGRRLEMLFRSLGEGQGSIALLRDRTEELDMEEKLRQAEKLAAVGRMAAAVAHEVRNPLSSLRGFAQFFARRLAGQKPDEEYAATMVREADRLNKVITDLLFLARPRVQALEPVDARAVADEVARLIALDVEERGARLVVEGGGVVLGDADGLKQILLNLLLNALAALPGGGGEAAVRVSAAGRMVRVSVSDNGRGMVPEERDRALEPFFTTREGGTGLGLPIVQSIVESWGGSLSIESVADEGTTVHVLLKEGTDG